MPAIAVCIDHAEGATVTIEIPDCLPLRQIIALALGEPHSLYAVDKVIVVNSDLSVKTYTVKECIAALDTCSEADAEKFRQLGQAMRNQKDGA